jgi:hypothetical protein
LAKPYRYLLGCPREPEAAKKLEEMPWPNAPVAMCKQQLSSRQLKMTIERGKEHEVGEMGKTWDATPRLGGSRTDYYLAF